MKTLLVIYLEGSQDDGSQKLPEDLEGSKSKVMAAFYSEGEGKKETDFLDFEEALSAGTKEVMGGKTLVIWARKYF